MHVNSRAAGSPQRPDHKGLYLAFLVGLGIILGLVYLPMWRIAPYLDDLAMMRSADAGLFEGYAGRHMFRPLELLVIQWSFDLADSALIAKAVGFAGFLSSIGLVFWLARRIDPQPAVVIVAVALFACHPVNVSAVVQIDTLSQQFATVFVLGGFAWYLFGPYESPFRYHAIGAGLSLLALLSKEVAAGAILALPLAAALVQRIAHGRPMPLVARRWLTATVIAAGLLLAYMAMRMWSGAALAGAGGRYSLEYDPLAVAVDCLMLLGSMAYLGSTLEVFVLESAPRIALSLLISLVVNGLAFLGFAAALLELYRGSADRRSSGLIGAAALMLLASLFPAALIEHPSELYVYLGVPFYALLVACFAVRGALGVARWFRLPMRHIWLAGAGAIAACCLWLLFGVHEKLAFAERMGERTKFFSEQMAPWYVGDGAPLAEMVACVAVTDQADADEPYYSVFKVPDQELLRYTHAWLEHQYAKRQGRPGRPVEHDQCQVVIEVGDEGRLRLRQVER